MRNVLFVASEAVPFCKTGGLADVIGALPVALAAGGERVGVVLPYYRAVRKAGFQPAKTGLAVKVPIGGKAVAGEILRLEHRGVSFYFVDAPEFFDRDQLYGDENGDYQDGADRFVFFARAAIEVAGKLDWTPDIFHCHDWQSGLVPVFLKTLYAGQERFARARTLFTIHNMAYQGAFPPEVLSRAGLPEELFTSEGLEFWGKVSFLKGGIAFADRVSTVSPTYAREIRTEGFGCGLHGLLQARSGVLSGILNGIDGKAWNPASDASLPRTYDASSFPEGKQACKKALREAARLDPASKKALVGTVSRLDHQKGLDMAVEAMAGAVERGAQYVVVGTGSSELASVLEDFAGRYRGQVYFRNRFDEAFAHLVYAGSDAFLMPSRFEPCGLGQLIAMRYGTVPVAVRTGGLADTVEPHGFLAGAAETRLVQEALGMALDAFKDTQAWTRRVSGMMQADFSWQKSAGRYRELYSGLIKGKDVGTAS